jgi:hypothetical protein
MLQKKVEYINGRLKIVEVEISEPEPKTTRDMQEASMKMIQDSRLTPEQIQTWRNVLLNMLGPYALIMPDWQVQKMRDVLQARLDKEM